MNMSVCLMVTGAKAYFDKFLLIHLRFVKFEIHKMRNFTFSVLFYDLLTYC